MIDNRIYGKHTVRSIEPLIVASPTGFGVYALTTLIIDAIAARSFGRPRRQIAMLAAYAAIVMPVVMTFAALSLKMKIVMAIIIVGTLLTL